VSGRVDRLVEGLGARDLAAMLVTADANLRYLTGYSGDNAIALLAAGTRRLITDGRYATSARQEVSGAEVVIGERDLVAAVGEAIASLGPGARVGVEADDLTLARFDRLRSVAGEAELVPVRGVAEDLRVVKDAEEVELIAAAAGVADRALERVIGAGVVGRREAEVAMSLVAAMIDEGAEGASFDPIVASGPRGALPHAVPSREPIPPDTLLTVDLGARRAGYCSDMTRTFATGTPPAELLAAYAACARSQRRALAEVRPGITGADLDAVARDSLVADGLGDRFVHGLGHGVGVQIHERPGIRRTGEEALRPGMVITVEPGVYLEGVGGVRIEDLVLVTEQGSRVLSGFPHGDGDEPLTAGPG
jgi:Xaa-Pro aminopeptidase